MGHSQPAATAVAPIGVYVHWPYCARICPYCDFNVRPARGREGEAAALGEALLGDLRAQAASLGPRRLESIFFGGGTPSLMDPALAAGIIDAAQALFPPGGGAEVTLEANPADGQADRFAAFAAAGVNRLSVGVQSLDDAALKFLGRDHDAHQARVAINFAAATFPRLSLDLIYALPGQTPGAWRDQLAEVLALGPQHLSAYQLTIEARTSFGRQVRRGALAEPSAEAAADLFETTAAVLSDAGFEAYEISNHARDRAARGQHNVLVWRGGQYLGVGPGAHGRIERGGRRFASLGPRAPADYIERVRRQGSGCSLEPLSPRQRAIERLIMGLRTHEGLDLNELAPVVVAGSALADLEQAGLLSVEAGRIALAPAGLLLADRVTAALASNLEAPPAAA